MSRNDLDFKTRVAPMPPVVPSAHEEQLPLFSQDALKQLRAGEEKWRAEVKPPWKKDFTTVSGMETNPLATPLSIADQDFNEIGFPGEFPYTRGVHPTGYRGRLWTMRQFAGFGTATQTNQRFKYLL